LARSIFKTSLELVEVVMDRLLASEITGVDPYKFMAVIHALVVRHKPNKSVT
jgi:hypothetical protein